MSLGLGQNLGSLRAIRQLGENRGAFGRALERLSSGARINRAGDDAAGMAVSTRLNQQARVVAQGVRNLNDGVSALNIADGALDQLSSILDRQRELAVQASSGSFSSTQRSALDAEFQALSDEYARIIETTSYNGKKLLSSGQAFLGLQAGGSALDIAVRPYATQLEGTGSFKPEYSYNYAPGTANLAKYLFLTTDLNGDGVSDLIAVAGSEASGFSSTVELKVVLGGSFATDSLSTNIFYSDPNPDIFLDVGFDGQGNVQISISDFGGGTVIGTGEFSFNPDGTIAGFTPNGDSATGAQASLEVDLNGDGVADKVDRINGGSGFEIQVQETNELYLPEDLTQSNMSVLDVGNAKLANTELELLKEKVSRARGVIGASLSRVDVAASVLSAREEGLLSSASRITDADIAEESAALARSQILEEVGAAVLAQANQQPELVLSLLQ